MEGLGSTFQSIIQGLSYINPLSEDFILADIINWMNPLSEDFFLADLFSSISNILSYLNPLSENFFGYKIIDLLKEALSFLFVPSQQSLENLSNEVKSHFAFINTINALVDDVKTLLEDTNGSPIFTLHVGASSRTQELDIKVLDLSWFAQFKQYSDAVITGFVYAVFIWRMYIKLPSIISGSGGDSMDIYNKYSKGGSKL